MCPLTTSWEGRLEKNVTFHTFTTIGDTTRKVIVDIESCINAISSKSLENLGLKIVLHPYPFKVPWIDSTPFEVKQWCLVPVNFNHYKDNIWCDVITMNVGQAILGRPWLFDKNVTIYGRSNMYQFEQRVNRLSYYPWNPRLDSPSRYPLSVPYQSFHSQRLTLYCDF